MTKEAIKKFVEEDYKDFVIRITCDNEHIYFYNASKNPSVVWDWDNNVIYALELNNEIMDQNKHPMKITQVSLDEIQFLTAFPDKTTILKFINEKFTDEDKKKEAKEILQRTAPAMMGPRSLDRGYVVEDTTNRDNIMKK